MKLPNQTLKIIRHKVIYDGLLRKISRLMTRMGLAFKFYYIFEEGLFGNESKGFSLGSEVYEITFLSYEDMQSLDCVDGRDETVVTLQDRICKGHKCLGLKIDDKIAGFTWCRFDIFAYPPSKGFTLKENEAYLYDMYVLKAYRGINLAPLLRYKLYQELNKIGRTVLYSMSLIPNSPAIRFKQKLDAQILSMWLYIQMSKNISWNLKLKTYR